MPQGLQLRPLRENDYYLDGQIASKNLLFVGFSCSP